jgi:hypothetical protein
MTTPDVGQTIRFPSTSLLTIDSEDRWADYNQARGSLDASDNFYNNPNLAPYVDPFNFRLQGNQMLSTGFFTRLGVSEVVMPWCPNINPKTNKIVVNWNVNNGANIGLATITLNTGYYTPDILASSIQQLIRQDLSGDGLAGFLMGYGANGYPCFSYNSGDAGTAVSFSPLPYGSSAYPYPPTTKQLFDVLGFTAVNNPPIPIPATLVGPQIGSYTLCQAIRYVDIVCPRLVQYQGLFDGSSQGSARDSLCRVYLGGFQSNLLVTDPDFAPTGTLPVVVYRNFTTPKQIQWIAKQNISANLEFQVYGDDGQLFSSNFPAGLLTQENWSMTLLLSEN